MRFNRVFWLLMAMGITSALVLPTAGDRFKGKLDILFVPVSAPVRGITMALHDHLFSRPAARDDQGNTQTLDQLKIENEALRNNVSNLKVELDDIYKRVAETDKMGNLAPFCEPFKVSGGDSGEHQSLLITSETIGTLLHLSEQMPVLRPEGIVGKVEHTGPGEARVRLITDRSFHLTVTFARFINQSTENIALQELAAPPTSARGDGKGKMLISQLSLEQVKEYQLTEGDRVLLHDPDGWPAVVQGQTIGRIAAIGPDARHPKFAEIVVTPLVDLGRLREVMVLDKSVH